MKTGPLSPSSLTSRALATTLLGLAATACGLQHDDQYPGEALASIQGQVINELPAAPATQVTIGWMYDTGSGDEFALDTVDVEGEFPAAFTLTLYGTPSIPEGAFGAVGLFYAIDPATFDPEQDDAGGGVLGMAEHHAIVYLAQPSWSFDEATRLEIEGFLGGPVDAGYSLYSIELDTDDEDPFDQLVPLPADGEINVRLAPYQDLLVPNIF